MTNERTFGVGVVGWINNIPMSMHCDEEVPWREIALTGLILTPAALRLKKNWFTYKAMSLNLV